VRRLFLLTFVLIVTQGLPSPTANVAMAREDSHPVLPLASRYAFTQVSAGYLNSCGLKSDGTVSC
jgi:hypothetical protein